MVLVGYADVGGDLGVEKPGDQLGEEGAASLLGQGVEGRLRRPEEGVQEGAILGK